MSTLTKEWLQKTISELVEERDATPGTVNEDAAMALEAMKRALASLMAEPVTTSYKLPDGWVAVPVEPTPEMARAALFKNTNDAVWKAMIAAAPQQENI